jgi:hypothetical protein
MARPSSWESDIQRLLLPRGFLRLILLGAAVQIGAVLLLGLAFFILCLGLSHGVTRLGIYWRPAYRALARLEGISLDPAQPVWRYAPIPGYRIPLAAIHAAISVALVVFAVWLFLRTGFCGQNLLCLALR